MNRDEMLRLASLTLEEDLAGVGDITTDAVIAETSRSLAHMATREAGVVCGLELAEVVFRTVDDSVVIDGEEEGKHRDSGDVVMTVEGKTRSILTAERSALNLAARASGVATATSWFVAAVEGIGARISDTRKTMPGLRSLDKYAVRMGGGINHRMGLHDAVMIKDNHIVAAGDIAKAVASARSAVGADVMIEVEVEGLGQLAEVLQTDADRVLLDNMDLETLKKAVVMSGDSIVTEASGGVTLENVREIAETGVDIISIGWITHSAAQLDLGLDFAV